MILNKVGKIVEEEWLKSPRIRQNVELDKFVVMPNHLHGILIINNFDMRVETPRRGVSTSAKSASATSVSPASNKPQPHHLAWKPNSVGSIINQFKSVCTKRIQQIQPAISKIWQSGFHDRIIRDEAEFNRIQSYILTNPENWEKDEIFRR